jgi:hydrocephalus-inducing protein
LIFDFLLFIRNKDKVARSVKIIPPDSKLFTVTPAKKSMMTTKKPGSSISSAASDIDQMSTKVAPGMEISYIIKFSAQAKVDYAYDLMVVTEREKFIVPIRARGCRAMLDFPDQLDFGLVPVKFETEKPVMIRNIGEKPTKWHISVPSNFKLDQYEGILEIGQSQQLVFHFVPQEAKKYVDELRLSYEGLEADI